MIILWSAGMLFGFGCRGARNADAPEIIDTNIPAEYYLRKYAAPLPEASGGVVISVNTEIITAEDIISPVEAQLSELAGQSDYEIYKEKAVPILGQVLYAKLTNALLYQHARETVGANIDEERLDKAVEDELKKFVAKFEGSYSKAQAELEKMGLDWNSFKEQQRKVMLTQTYISGEVIAQPAISYSELVDYYNLLKDKYFTKAPVVQFRLIDIDPELISDAANIAEKKQKAEALVSELIAKLDMGEDFSELAKKYSTGHNASKGGLWQPIRPGSLAAPFDKIEQAAGGLEAGQFAGPIEINNHLYIVKLEDKQPGETVAFEQVQSQLEAKLMFERKTAAVDKIMRKLISNSNIPNTDEFMDYCIKKSYRRFNSTK